MRSLAEWVFDVGYERKWYLPVRDDFISWYSVAWDHQNVRDSLLDENLSQLAYQAGRSAIHFDPDNPVVNTVDLIDIYLEKIQTIRAYAEVLGFSGLIAALWGFSANIGILIPGFLLGISGLVLAPPAIFRVLVHQMRSNIELIQKFNDELVKMDIEIWTNRDPRYRSAYFLWNRSLNKPNVFPVLVFLAVLRVISPSLYGTASAKLRENMTEYIEEGVWEVSKKEFIELWKSR